MMRLFPEAPAMPWALGGAILPDRNKCGQVLSLAEFHVLRRAVASILGMKALGCSLRYEAAKAAKDAIASATAVAEPRNDFVQNLLMIA